MAVTVESETLEAFLPDLVTAVCDDVQRIADQCLSIGLISDSGRRKILELRGSSEDQARALILSILNSTKTDNRCFETFLDCLDGELPRLVKEKLLPNIRKDLEDRHQARQDGVICKAIESPSSQSQITRFMQQGDPQECERQQRSLFGRYERSVKNHAFAFSERAQCKESLQCKTEEREKLRGELTSLGEQNSETKEIETTKERLSACEAEMAELRERIEKLEVVIEEEDMQARRGKNIIMVGTKMFVRMTEHAFKEKEEEYKRLFKEKEDELEKRMQEEKAREQQVAQAQGKVEREIERELRKPVEFNEAYGELLPFADEWRSIGILMEVPLNTIKEMGVEQTDSSICLAEVLDWIQRKRYEPTRKQFNEIMKKIKAKVEMTH